MKNIGPGSALWVGYRFRYLGENPAKSRASTTTITINSETPPREYSPIAIARTHLRSQIYRADVVVGCTGSILQNISLAVAKPQPFSTSGRAKRFSDARISGTNLFARMHSHRFHPLRSSNPSVSEALRSAPFNPHATLLHSSAFSARSLNLPPIPGNWCGGDN